MTPRRAAALGLACLLTVVVACADSDDGDGDDATDGGAAPEEGTTAEEETTTVTRDPDADLRVVSINVLHGIFCPPETVECRRAERIDLLATQLQDAGCPHLVALQEVSPNILAEVERVRPSLCDGAYEVVWHGNESVDRELVISTLPVVEDEFIRLAGPIRSAYRVRVDSGLGPVDIVVTHLASSDNPPCIPRLCPPPCVEEDDTRTCQARQVADLLEDNASPSGMGLLVGDLNAPVGSPPIDLIADRGWVDSHLAAGNAECVPDTGEQCSSGREDQDLDDLVDPTSRQVERIDFIWVAPGEGCQPAFDGPGDGDGDGLATGLFHPEPAVGGPAGLAFVSDHTGTALDMGCT